MSLTAGARLGAYEILGPLGAGGMGEVYRARDPRLERDVAVKVLPEEFLEGEERKARFEREARVLASLNHSGIAAIYSFEEIPSSSSSSPTRHILVMELVEGETLREALRPGALPAKRAVEIAVQIARGLAAAHEKGVVHRDLKPENVILEKDGRAKILDFGLAKLAQPLAAGESLSAAGTLSNLTEAGAVFGTLSYMSPEQVCGESVDHRSDIFSFGTVLYEMLSGSNPFRSATAAETMAAILRHEPPPLSDVPAPPPAALGAIVMRCLEKKREARFQSTRDLAFALEALAAGSAPSASARALASSVEAPRPGSRMAVVALAAALAGAAVTAVVLKTGAPRPKPAPAIRFEVLPPAGGAFAWSGEGRPLGVSPDGSRLAWVARDARGARSIWLRPLESREARPLVGTEGASSLFWSPDGTSIAFFAGDKLKRLDLPSGAPVPIADVTAGGAKAGTWGADDILFGGVQGEALYRVPPSGGTPAVVLKPDVARGETRVIWPTFLPDGRRFLYVSRRGNEGTLMLAEPDKAPRAVMPDVSDTAYVDPGILVFAREGTLFAQTFDVRTGRMTGSAAALAESIRYFMSTGGAGFAVSRNGTLLYVVQEDVSRLERFDRAGRTGGRVSTPGSYLSLSLSPDGRRALYDRARPGIWTYDIWSFDYERGVESRVTSDIGSEFAPLWLPDGRGFIYSAVAGSNPRLYRMDLATGKSEEVVPGAGFQEASDVSADGRFLAYSERQGRNFTLRTVALSGPRTPVVLGGNPSVDYGAPRFSPDGRFLAFLCDESGRREAYVMPYPGPGEKTRVSPAGARHLCWPRGTGEILFLSADGHMTSVPVRTSPVLAIGRPVVLFPTDPAWSGFDVTADGKRFLAIVPEIDGNRYPATVVVNGASGGAK